MAKTRSGIKMTKQNRLAILREARKIIGNPKRWTHGALRKRRDDNEKAWAYCALGACEEAAYRLKLVPRPRWSFDMADGLQLGYALGEDLSLQTFCKENTGHSVQGLNDQKGYVPTLTLLDNYIAEVEAGKAREPS